MTRDFYPLEPEPVRPRIDWDHYRDMAVRERRKAIAQFPGRMRVALNRTLTARQLHSD